MHLGMDCFEEVYSQVASIVNCSRQKYYIQLWEYDDWHQEGRIILYKLMQSQPGIEDDYPRLLVYFKTRFTSHVKDVLRGQESQKRRFNKMVYEEISEVGQYIPTQKIALDEKVALEDALRRFVQGLPREELSKYQRLICGEGFKGRKAMLRQLANHLSDFR